jgi:DNA-binding NarL/FixJ family response regulator
MVPNMLREIIAEALEDAPDMRLVGAPNDRQELLRLAYETKPDVVILEMQHPEQLEECRTLLYSLPSVHALGISRDGRDSFMYALRPHQEPLGNISTAGLLSAIRAAATLQAE